MSLSYRSLWVSLAEKGLNKIEVIKMADISTNVMAKMWKNQAIHLKNLEKLFVTLDLTLYDDVEFVDYEE